MLLGARQFPSQFTLLPLTGLISWSCLRAASKTVSVESPAYLDRLREDLKQVGREGGVLQWAAVSRRRCVIFPAMNFSGHFFFLILTHSPALFWTALLHVWSQMGLARAKSESEIRAKVGPSLPDKGLTPS